MKPRQKLPKHQRKTVAKRPAIHEAFVQDSVVAVMLLQGWKVMRLNSGTAMMAGQEGRSRPFRSYMLYGFVERSKGAPDLIAWKHGRCLFIEVKSPVGKQSPAQRSFEKDVEKHCEYMVARSAQDVVDYIKKFPTNPLLGEVG